MKTIKTLLATAISAGLVFIATAQLREQPAEMIELKSLPTAVQIAGGEMVQIKREDDARGKRNYEVVIRTNGKKSGFETDPNGKFLRQQTEVKNNPKLVSRTAAAVANVQTTRVVASCD